jgi:hypothetical protein
MSPRRPGALLLAIWLAGAAAATGAGVLAVRLVATQVGDPAVPVLTTKEVTTALSDAPRPSNAVPSPTPSPAASPRPSRQPSQRPVSAPKAFSSQGGSIGVRCRGTVAELVYRTPAQGYALDETATEGEVLEVRFTNGRTRARLGVSCTSGAPVLVENRVDTSGGDD